MKQGKKPTVARAVAGFYDFDVNEVLADAWNKTNGLKIRFWKAFAIIALVTIATSIIAYSINSHFEGGITSAEAAAKPHPIEQIIQMVFSIFITLPLLSGLLMLCIKQCSGITSSFVSIFDYLGSWKKLWVLPVAMTTISLIKVYFIDYDLIRVSMWLLDIFVIVTYLMFIPLIVEKNLTILVALETSRKAIFHHWFKVLWFVLMISFIFFGSLLTAGVALIWTLPWIFNSIALLYKNIFGIQKSKSQTKESSNCIDHPDIQRANHIG